MRIKITFSDNKTPFQFSVNSEVNSFIHTCIGENNKFHGNFSNYCISTMQGGKMEKDGTINFPNGGVVYVSSVDDTFINRLLIGILKEPRYVGDMRCCNVDIADYNVMGEYDIIRCISPILLRKNNKFITYQNENFINALLEQSKSKLLKLGFNEEKVNTLSIIPFHFENGKIKKVTIKKDLFMIASQVMLIIKGESEIRKKLYELGLGSSTGYGFGHIILNK